MSNFISTGYRDLDDLIIGFTKGGVTVIDSGQDFIASLALQLATSHHKVAVFTNDLTEAEVKTQMVYHKACEFRIAQRIQENKRLVNKEWFDEEELSTAYSFTPFETVSVLDEKSAYRHQFHDKCIELKEQENEVVIFDVAQSVFYNLDISFFKHIAEELDLVFILVGYGLLHSKEIECADTAIKGFEISQGRCVYELEIIYSKHGCRGFVQLYSIRTPLIYNSSYEITCWFDAPFSAIEVNKNTIFPVIKEHPTPQNTEPYIVMPYHSHVIIYNNLGEVIGVELFTNREHFFIFSPNNRVFDWETFYSLNPNFQNYKGIEKLLDDDLNLVFNSSDFFQQKEIFNLGFTLLLEYLKNFHELKKLGISDFFHPSAVIDFIVVLRIFDIEICSSNKFISIQFNEFLNKIDDCIRLNKMVIEEKSSGEYFFNSNVNNPFITLIQSMK